MAISLPLFIYNRIIINLINDALFKICNYNKLYLEINEIINEDLDIFLFEI